MNAVKVLVVDDDEDDFFITSEYLKNIQGCSFIIEWCYKYKEALENICNNKYDIYFLDYRLGAKTGIQLLYEAQKNNCETPIVLLTGKGNQKIDEEAMQAGAVDYLVKSELTTEKLERCIRYALERANYLKALKANERKFRTIFERSKDAVFLADEKLFFRDINQATCELFNYSKEELLKLSLYNLLAYKQDEYFLEIALYNAGVVNDKELILLTSNKEKKICILSVTKETHINGNVYMQGIIHDITNLKRAEKITLQEEKLNATGRLVHTLAHEVRNPLNNINLSVEQLTAEMDNEEAKLYIDIIKRNSKRIGALISELLNSSKPTQIVLQKKSLQTVLDESIAAASDRITLKKIKLQVKYPDEMVYIKADAEKLKIAFLNVIINAIEAMQEEGNLNISLLKDGALNYKVIISDNGSGISDENMSRLFEPYFTSKRNGLGLGLASTLNILKSHKAFIDVQSKPNEGTTFTLKFEAA
ncbi:MAG: ATP-binding response regulator [Chitinophagaceae bacterium]